MVVLVSLFALLLAGGAISLCCYICHGGASGSTSRNFGGGGGGFSGGWGGDWGGGGGRGKRMGVLWLGGRAWDSERPASGHGGCAGTGLLAHWYYRV